MGLLKGKTEGGSGGKRGHSNMSHWVTTAEIKDASRKRRRLDSKGVVAEELQHDDADVTATPIRIDLPHDESEFHRLLGVAGIGAYACKRVEPWWYVRIDPAEDVTAIQAFLAVLRNANISYARITDHDFWSTPSSPF